MAMATPMAVAIPTEMATAVALRMAMAIAVEVVPQEVGPYHRPLHQRD
jgi:hypothetical protein